MVSSRRDKYFSVAAVQALYDRAGEPKKLIWTDTEHVGVRKADIVKELVRLIEAYLGGAEPALSTHQTSLPGTPYGAKPAKAQ